MASASSDDDLAVPAWETEVRAKAGTSGHYVDPLWPSGFPELSAALGIDGDTARLPEAISSRIRRNVHAVSGEHGGDRRFDEFRALLAGGCAWWGVTDSQTPGDQLVVLLDQHEANVELARTHLKVEKRLRRVGFRHALAWYAYRHALPGGDHARDLLESDYEAGRQRGAYGKRDLFQDAFVAVLYAMIEGDDPASYWDTATNTLVRPDPAALDGTRDLPLADPTKPVPSEARATAVLLQRRLPGVLAEAGRFFNAFDMRPLESWIDVERRLGLLADIDEVLRVFTPAIFDASLTELVPFLGSHSSDGAVEHFRDAARNEATRYLREGSELPVDAQMAESYAVARDCRRRWGILTPRSLPTGPVVGLNRFRDLVRDTSETIRGLDGYLTIPGRTLAVRMPLDKLRAEIELIARG